MAQSIPPKDSFYILDQPDSRLANSVVSSMKNRGARVATAVALPSYTQSTNSLTATTNGPLTVDGVLLSINNRVLVTKETVGNAPYNGIYYISSVGVIGGGGSPWVLTRTEDMNSSSQVKGSIVGVSEGSIYASTVWLNSNAGTFILNTTNMGWAEIGGAAVSVGDVVNSATNNGILFVDGTTSLAEDASNLFYTNGGGLSVLTGITSPGPSGSTYFSEVFGNGATANGGHYNLAIGYNASAGVSGNNTAIGASASANGNYNLAVGRNTSVGSGLGQIALGTDSQISGSASYCALIGTFYSGAAVANTIGFGGNGGSTYAMNNVFFGQGISDTFAVADVTIKPTTTTLAATPGAHLILSGGTGTSINGIVKVLSPLYMGDNGTTGATSGTATLNNSIGLVTSESLNTAGLSTYTLTLTNTKASSSSLVSAVAYLGSSATGAPQVISVTSTSDQIVFVVRNNEVTGAFAGTIQILYQILNP